MQNVIIVGAGKGGTAILKLFHQIEFLKIIGVADQNNLATGMELAKQLNIPIYESYADAINHTVDIIVETTGDDNVFQHLKEIKPKDSILIPGTVAHIIYQLLSEKEKLVDQLRKSTRLRELILKSIHDGLIVINTDEKVTYVNDSALSILGIEREGIIHKDINMVVKQSQLTEVLKTKQIEVNVPVSLDNGKKVIATRIPLISEQGELLGAFSVFKDITEVVQLAEEVTDLKEVQTMLNSIIQSSEEAITVVDENGIGIMINPAYTKITGLTEKDVIGKPATIDIAEGESMHMKVLKTRKPVRGVRMKVGPKNRDVLVNVAPIIVDGELKGSVGVIHDVSEIESLTSQLKDAQQIIRNLEAKYTFDDIIAVSDDMKLTLEQAKVGANIPATVLLRGESGTGKELIAHAIHNESNRKNKKFIRVNCAMYSEKELEKILFGYEKGSPNQRHGIFEDAHNGSVFLDEIGELSINLQKKILRLLEKQEINRVGGDKPIIVDVRIIAATNVNLERAIMTGEFREDLFYRLSKFPIFVPPLRDRLDDLEPLINHFIKQLNESYGRNVKSISKEALKRLKKYSFPGNVRELENIIGRSMINMKNNEEIIEEAHLPPLRRTLSDFDFSEANSINEIYSLQDALDEFEKLYIMEVLEKNNYIKSKTAKQLNISVRNLYYKMKKHNLSGKEP